MIWPCPTEQLAWTNAFLERIKCDDSAVAATEHLKMNLDFFRMSSSGYVTVTQEQRNAVPEGKVLSL
ncbi:hypothetical protein RvY_01451 [Ramazzottius varieornatus]|uniref:Uncharacterized protein n=1 Tax=Ramazzottius varieornatus TaxID=947166 RepID=A0A1D1UGC9_RAMVA|nr:hypothetical protein RvY_01451 [Ramazzottius varieornatus]